MLAVNVLYVNCVTVAYGERCPSQGLHGSNDQGHQTNQVEHDTVETLQITGEERGIMLLRCHHNCCCISDVCIDFSRLRYCV